MIGNFYNLNCIKNQELFSPILEVLDHLNVLLQIHRDRSEDHDAGGTRLDETKMLRGGGAWALKARRLDEELRPSRSEED